MTALVRWWMIFCSIVSGFVVLTSTGLIAFAWQADHSKISFVNLILFCLITPFIGWLTKSIVADGNRSNQRFLQACWFASEAMMGIGMMGTLVGFMMMFTDAMAHMNINDTNTIKTIIISLSRGFTTGLVTTLIGISTSILVKTQLVNLEVSMSLSSNEEE